MNAQDFHCRANDNAGVPPRRPARSALRRALGSALLLGASTLSHAADPAVLSIPVVTPLSGATSVIGQDTMKSLDIAMRHIAELSFSFSMYENEGA